LILPSHNLFIARGPGNKIEFGILRGKGGNFRKKNYVINFGVSESSKFTRIGDAIA